MSEHAKITAWMVIFSVFCGEGSECPCFNALLFELLDILVSGHKLVLAVLTLFQGMQMNCDHGQQFDDFYRYCVPILCSASVSPWLHSTPDQCWFSSNIYFDLHDCGDCVKFLQFPIMFMQPRRFPSVTSYALMCGFIALIDFIPKSVAVQQDNIM